ncbi:hypothetical protein DYB36_005803 [Aphanomyces astaci]|uniref:Uncharacterized protein n=1 Tax=Aphanomyces astaci TaxID=112090 RepID=A0A396ZUK3_APHAT|nr:hypothetical protein DYB36_005803 [Aphanomyces astaci]
MTRPSQAEVLLLKLFHASRSFQHDAGKDWNQREFLVLGEIAALQDTGKVPLSVDLMQLGILYALNGADRDREPGQFEFHDLYDFVERCESEENAAARGTHVPTYYKQSKEARCALDLWEVAVSDGVGVISTWLMQLLRENGRAIPRGYHEDSDCVASTTLRLLGRVLRLDDGWDDVLPVIHVIGIGQPSDSKMETWRRISDVADFVESFLTGWIEQLGRVGVTLPSPISS